MTEKLCAFCCRKKALTPYELCQVCSDLLIKHTKDNCTGYVQGILPENQVSFRQTCELCSFLKATAVNGVKADEYMNQRRELGTRQLGPKIKIILNGDADKKKKRKSNRNKSDKNKPEKIKSEKNKPEKIKSEKNKPEKIKSEKNKLEKTPTKKSPTESDTQSPKITRKNTLDIPNETNDQSNESTIIQPKKEKKSRKKVPVE